MNAARLLLALVTVGVLAAGSDSAARAPASSCRGVAMRPAPRLRVLGWAAGDMDGDGRAERVSLRANDRRPFRCRYLLMTRQGRRVHMRVLILAHPDIAATGAEPVLVGLAGIARGHGLQAVVDGRCCGAYVSGQWLFEETRSELRQIHVRGRIDADPDTFPNGASLTHGMTSVCGPRRGEVLVLSLGRTARNVMVVGSTQRFVQRGDTFVSTSFVERQEPFRFEDFENCRPWIRAHAKRP